MLWRSSSVGYASGSLAHNPAPPPCDWRLPAHLSAVGRQNRAPTGPDALGSRDPGLAVTLSIVLAELGPGMDTEQLMAEDDSHLYLGKRGGRDRVCP